MPYNHQSPLRWPECHHPGPPPAMDMIPPMELKVLLLGTAADLHRLTGAKLFQTVLAARFQAMKVASMTLENPMCTG